MVAVLSPEEQQSAHADVLANVSNMQPVNSTHVYCSKLNLLEPNDACMLSLVAVPLSEGHQSALVYVLEQC